MKRITDACAYRNVETPTWTTDGYFVTVTFKRPDYNADGIKDGIKDCIKELSERQVDILSMIAEDCTITSQKIAQKIAQKGSVSQRTIMYDLADLQAKGIIAREGGRKNGRWVILKPLE